MHYRPSARPSALLVLCHPSEGPSMCRALADLWEEGLQKEGVEVVRVELRGLRRLGLAGPEELHSALTGKESPDGSAPTPEVRRLQELVEEARFLVFVHPIFWFDVPFQLKGFQESVLSSGFAFRKLPSHWLLNLAAGVVEKVPIVRSLMRRYSAYGLLRDKLVYVTRTQGGPSAGMGIFGHEATSLESAMQFCGAHLSGVDVVSELDSCSEDDLAKNVLPRAAAKIQVHCREIAAVAASAASLASARATTMKALPPCNAVATDDTATIASTATGSFQEKVMKG